MALWDNLLNQSMAQTVQGPMPYWHGDYAQTPVGYVAQHPTLAEPHLMGRGPGSFSHVPTQKHTMQQVAENLPWWSGGPMSPRFWGKDSPLNPGNIELSPGGPWDFTGDIAGNIPLPHGSGPWGFNQEPVEAPPVHQRPGDVPPTLGQSDLNIPEGVPYYADPDPDPWSMVAQSPGVQSIPSYEFHGELGSPNLPVSPREQAVREERSRQEPDVFGGYVDRYNKQTEDLVQALQTANRRSMFFNLGSAFLGSGGRWSDALSGVGPALSQYAQTPLQVEALRSEREEGMWDRQSEVAALAMRNQDTPSWAEKRSQAALAKLSMEYEQGLISDEEFDIRLNQALGAKYQTAELAGLPVLISPTGEYILNGRILEDDQVQQISMMEGPTEDLIEDQIAWSQAQQVRKSKVEYAMSQGATQDEAERMADMEGLFGMRYPGWTPPGPVESMDAINRSVEQARQALKAILVQDGMPENEADQFVMGASDQQIMDTFASINQ